MFYGGIYDNKITEYTFLCFYLPSNTYMLIYRLLAFLCERGINLFFVTGRRILCISPCKKNIYARKYQDRPLVHPDTNYSCILFAPVMVSLLALMV